MAAPLTKSQIVKLGERLRRSAVPDEDALRALHRFRDAWAQCFERFADRFGRGIRYGEPLENPAATLGGMSAAAIFEGLQKASEQLALAEYGETAQAEQHKRLKSLQREVSDLASIRAVEQAANVQQVIETNLRNFAVDLDLSLTDLQRRLEESS